VRLEPTWQVEQIDDLGVTLALPWTLGTAREHSFMTEIWTRIDGTLETHQPMPLGRAMAVVETARADWLGASAVGETSHLVTQRALDRGLDDLDQLLNHGPAGDPFVAAGVPWYSCLFGRDSLITSLQLLPLNAAVARDTLVLLARLQATSTDEWRDAQPGKILHELRTGEMARANEIPFTPYYGTIDATPLWLMLLDEYQRWTADDELVDQLWPHALAAVAWLDDCGDLDGDGLIEYHRASERGLTNQGWKDSWDAISMRDGTLATPPIALVEVQAYAYAGRQGIARLAELRGDTDLAARQRQRAERLRGQFEEEFWMADAGIYALALDGAKRQVDAIASNAGHALWAGICTPERAADVARALTSEDMWSGWGIRTLSTTTGGYNPIGYHSGSVWPHDNAIIAAGLMRYGLADAAALVVGGLLRASEGFAEARLPELFSGFSRAEATRPVPYPVACSPQAWAAGSIFQLVGAMLGLQPDAGAGRLAVRPALPEWLDDVAIRRLRVGAAAIDLTVSRRAGGYDVDVQKVAGELDVSLAD
jgi:glycogen debranching enzyme